MVFVKNSHTAAIIKWNLLFVTLSSHKRNLIDLIFGFQPGGQSSWRPPKT